MTPVELLAAARALGIEFIPQPPSEIRLRGPKGALPAELREKLRAIKPELYALLTTPKAGQIVPSQSIGDLPAGFLTALRESGAAFHVIEERDAAALVVQPWSALPAKLQEDARRYGVVLAAILMGSARLGGAS